MLWLKRVVEPYEIHKCDYSGELIIRGEFYWEDDEDGYTIKNDIYKELLDKRKKETFDYTMLERAQSAAEHSRILELAEKEFLAQGILERKIAKNGSFVDSGVEY